MTLRKPFHIVSFIVLLVCIINSCQLRDNYCVLRIKIECYPSLYIDSIKTILLTDTYSDLGGSGGTSLFGPGRVVAKNVKRSSDNYFYLHKVKKAEYAILVIEGYVGGVLYGGNNREVNFSKIKGDTADIKICFEPNMKNVTGNSN